jgi:ribosomal protein S27AE
VKCPRCGGRFGALAGSLVARGFLSRAVNFCPYCGVNLDDSYDKQP